MRHLLLTSVLVFSACEHSSDVTKDAPTDAAKDASRAPVFADGRWLLRIDRAWERMQGSVQFPTDEFTEADYQAVAAGKVYEVVVSDGTQRVEVGAAPFRGRRREAEAERYHYELSEGTFAGGRFLVWASGDGPQGELTLYGSGVPIVQSERGPITPAP